MFHLLCLTFPNILLLFVGAHIFVVLVSILYSEDTFLLFKFIFQ